MTVVLWFHASRHHCCQSYPIKVLSQFSIWWVRVTPPIKLTLGETVLCSISLRPGGSTKKSFFGNLFDSSSDEDKYNHDGASAVVKSVNDDNHNDNALVAQTVVSNEWKEG